MKTTNFSRICYTLLSVSMICLCHRGLAQQDDILRRLKAEQIKNSIYLHVDDGVIRYHHDVEESHRTSAGFLLADREKPLWTARSGKIMLTVGFYNPYQYSVRVKSEVTDDPISETTEQFFAALTGFLNVVTIGTSSPALAGGVHEKVVAAAKTDLSASLIAPSNDPSVYTAQFRSTAMLEWAMWNKTWQCGTKPDQVLNLVKDVAEIEMLLYQKIKIGHSALFQNHVKEIANDLFKATESKQFSSKLIDARQYYNLLLQKVSEVRGNLKNVKTSYEFTMKSTDECLTFQKYNTATFSQYINDTEDKFGKFDKVLSALNDLIKVGEDFELQNQVLLFNGEQKEIIYNKELIVEDDKINTVTIEVKRQTLEPDDPTLVKTKSEFSRSFDLIRYRKAWPEISSGIFYSGIEYNEFSVGTSTSPDGGGTTTAVVEQTTKKQHVMAALFYNQVFDFALHPIYPFLQAGVGTGKEYPCLLGGAGFRIINKNQKRISVSAGAVFNFTKELDELSVGSVITGGQAEIDDDVVYRLGNNVGFYVGLAWKID